MPCVPSSLDALLVLFASCFTAPSFVSFRALVVGQVSQTGLRTVTGMLVGSRLSGVGTTAAHTDSSVTLAGLSTSSGCGSPSWWWSGSASEKASPPDGGHTKLALGLSAGRPRPAPPRLDEPAGMSSR